jgi:hypothetical protein
MTLQDEGFGSIIKDLENGGGGGGVPTSRAIHTGNGLSGGGDLTADRTLTVVADPEGSISVGVAGVKVGVLASDAEHGVRGGGTQHALATGSLPGFLSAAGFTRLSQLPQPLSGDRTVYCNSATGNDTTGDGSSGNPWQTLARAWADRLTYGELRAVYTIQLLGVGPYTWPQMGASVCGVGGYFIVRGDPTVDVAIASGTFTGDIVNATGIIPTSAGLGVDTLKTYFLEFTSGNNIGVRVNINTNTDTSISIPSRGWRLTSGLPIVNGDTFRVFAPGTAIDCPLPANNGAALGLEGWVGGSCFSSNRASHLLYNLALTGSRIVVTNACVAFVGVRSTFTSTVIFDANSKICAFASRNSFYLGVGANNLTDKLAAYGFISVNSSSTIVMEGSSTLAGTCYIAGLMLIGAGSADDICITNGGRYDGGASIDGGKWEELSTATTYTVIGKTISMQNRGRLMALCGAGAKWKWTPTVGDCISMQRDCFVYLDNSGSAGVSGGTTAATGFGIHLTQGGGRVVINGAASLTGGTPGQDIKTTTLAPQSNAFLAASGDFISDLGGAESIVRA